MAHSQAWGTVLFLAAVGTLLSALTAAETKVVPALVMGLTASRFLVTGLFEVTGSADVRLASGAVGCLLAAVAVYAAWALELEGLEHRTVLPTFRRGRGARALDPDLAEQVRMVAATPGVRNEL